MEEMIVPLIFFGVIAGFTTLGVGLRVFQKWANHRIMSEDGEERITQMEYRMAELEERVDFSERALAEVRSRPRLDSGNSPLS